MKTRSFILFAGAVLALAAGRGLAADARTIVITANDLMKYDVRRIEASPGEHLRVQLRNRGTLPLEVMGHNWILLRAGTDPTGYATAAANAKPEHFRPAAHNADVLAAIPLIGAGQTAEVEFDAPAQRGTYPYLCSFPGHSMIGMRGELVVQ